jgi:hypothetical protein
LVEQLANGGNIDMTDLIPIRKAKATQVSLADLQVILDHKKAAEETRSPASTLKARVEEAKRDFAANPIVVLDEMRDLARRLFDVFDPKINSESVPLTQSQVNSLSREFLYLEKLKVKMEALEARYRDLIFGHLDKTRPQVPGRPASQVPGVVKAEGPEDHYEFERRGGNRKDPDLNVQGLLKELPEDVANKILVTVHHEATEAWDETVFDEHEFIKLVDSGVIDLDTVAKHLTPGEWRTPSFHKILVHGVGYED